MYNTHRNEKHTKNYRIDQSMASRHEGAWLDAKYPRRLKRVPRAVPVGKRSGPLLALGLTVAEKNDHVIPGALLLSC